MEKIGDKYNNYTFENIEHIDDYGNEYWVVHDLQKVLEYKDWRNFQKVIDKAVITAKNSVLNEEDGVIEVNKPIKNSNDFYLLREDRQEYKNDIPMLVASDELTPKEEKEIKEPKEDNKIDENMLINSINEEDEYVLYHIHTVGISDSIESITKKYNISVNTLKEYNSFENLELNMKLIIPNEEL